ncbi:MAG: hypothetical protein EBR26_02150 [Microbacteriaceae bacterium]|nr:hypothetical protein [Microbacteriaceae bacterium]
MQTWIKKGIILISAAALALVGLSPARAESTPSLTFQQFLASDGYKDLMETSAASAKYISTQSGLRMTMVNSTVSTPDGMSSSGSTVVEATKTKLKLTTTTEGISSTSWIIDGFAYYPAITKLMNGEMPLGIEKRIPDVNSKYLKTATIPDFMGTMTPEKIFSETDSGIMDSLNPVGEIMSWFTFSEVTKTADVENPEKITYEFKMALTFLGMTQSLTEGVVFNGDYISELNISSDSNFGQTMSISAVIEVVNDLVIQEPDMATVITDETITRISKQMAAEGKLTSKASAIVKKATTLAKQAKTALASKHLVSAATALKTKVTKITGGVKLTTTYQSVAGSLCIRIVKAKAVTKNC